MLMPGRSFDSEASRFGFNGQEKDDEISGAGNHNTATFWEYDTRLGRRWNIDPVIHSWESPYCVMGNSPIAFNDPLGDEVKNGDRIVANEKKQHLANANKKLL